MILSDAGERLLSSNHSCPICGFSVPKLEPRLFSFNAPLGYCPTCKGLGIDRSVAVDLLVPDPTKTINQGAIRYYKNIVGSANLEWQEFCVLLDHYHIPYDVPWQDLTDDQKNIILYGSKEDINHGRR